MNLVRLRLAVVAAVLAAVALAAAGASDLASPPATSWEAADAWYRQVGAGAAAIAGLRFAALCGVGWLAVASSLQLLASVSLVRAIQEVADAASPLVLRRLAHGALGVSVTVALAGGSGAGDPAGTTVMEVVDDPAPPSTLAPPTTLPPPTAPAAEPAVPVTVTAPDDEVVVAPGDSFWSIAVDVVSDAPRPPTVDEYWRRLVAANRGRLVDPSNPDLIYPGQVLILPTVHL